VRAQVVGSIGIALAAALLGLFASMRFFVPSGGAIVLALAALFALAHLLGRAVRG
jgi:ABC-type Mn2+/Zn2+ transport system permease subunit